MKSVDINIDYILLLVAKYHESHCKDSEIKISIDKAINASLELRSKRELIENFIAQINSSKDIACDWKRYVKIEQKKDLNRIIEEEGLNREATLKYITNAFREGEIKTRGTDIDKIMPSMSRFSGKRAEKKQGVIDKLKAFFEKYYSIGVPEFED